MAGQNKLQRKLRSRSRGVGKFGCKTDRSFYIYSDVSHTRPAAAGFFFGRRKLVADACEFHKESKGQILHDLERGQKVRCHRLHGRVLQSLGWRLAAEIACWPRYPTRRTRLLKIHDRHGHCEDLEVVQLDSAEFAR